MRYSGTAWRRLDADAEVVSAVACSRRTLGAAGRVMAGIAKHVTPDQPEVALTL